MSDFSAHSYPADNYQDLLNWLISEGAESWAEKLPDAIEKGLSFSRYGDLPDWLEVIDTAPTVQPSVCNFEASVNIGDPSDLDSDQRQALSDVLTGLMPWRKGPFDIFGVHLDAEWRSDMKWNRIIDKVSSLNGRNIIDIGCGNGYYMLRMLGQGAKRLVGVDPSPRFVVQFDLLKKLIGTQIPAHILPIRAEQLPTGVPLFDTAFSMGVLYHRREPQSHLKEISEVLKPGGEFILETLIIEGDAGDCLVPENRYAQMRNVWSIPSLRTLTDWVGQAGYEKIEVLDINRTTTEEQRRTPWMQFQSLGDFLDPQDSSKTVEGYPAPIRAAIRATRP